MTTYVIRKKRRGETTKKWEYSSKEAREIVKDLKKQIPDAVISMRRKKARRGRITHPRSNR